MMLTESPLHSREREDTHKVGPRWAVSLERIASYSDMTGPFSLLPGAGMGLDWIDFSDSRRQASSSGDGAGIAAWLGPGTGTD
jgi:hypothetical protein